ncbi:MAG: radical SAM protein [Candidatus Omnitrophota bacterium]
MSKNNKTIQLKGLNLIVTDDCNFACSYCPQRKEKKFMSQNTIRKALEFFSSHMTEDANLGFYGGEPLLAFDHIRYAVSWTQSENRDRQTRWSYSLTTNGSLMTDDVLRFFNDYQFRVSLSFDGLTQDMQRKNKSADPLRRLIQRIPEFDGITFAIFSVITPQTVPLLVESVSAIIRTGASEISLFISITQPWSQTQLDELKTEFQKLTDYLVSFYKQTGSIPVVNYRSKPRDPSLKFGCVGGRNQMAISSDERVWGCAVYYDYLKDKEGSDDYESYFFGYLDEFKTNYPTVYPRILANYSALRQDCFFSEKDFCYLCEEVTNCITCPVNSAYVTSMIGKNPPYICDINRIKLAEIKRFGKETE